MEEKRALLLHFLAALAYRTQKAVRGAGIDFAHFEAGNGVRTPTNLIRHMTSVLGYARTHFVGGSYRAEALPSFIEELNRFYDMLKSLGDHLENETPFIDITPERMLQGPFADAMTHAGQIAMLRRLAADPIRAENFSVADISSERLGKDQSDPVSPDEDWLGDPGYGPPPDPIH